MTRRQLGYYRRLASRGPERWFNLSTNYEAGDILVIRIVDGLVVSARSYRQYRFPRTSKLRINRKWRERMENFRPSEECRRAA